MILVLPIGISLNFNKRTDLVLLLLILLHLLFSTLQIKLI